MASLKLNFTDKDHVKHIYSAMNETERERFGIFRETNFEEKQFKKVRESLSDLSIDSLSDSRDW